MAHNSGSSDELFDGSRTGERRVSKGFQRMELDLLRIYQQYLAYHSCFRVRFDQLANSRLLERMRAPVMSYEEFTAVWLRWCDEGQEKYWRERFETGHEFHALKFEAAVKTLFIGSDMHLAKGKTQEAA